MIDPGTATLIGSGLNAVGSLVGGGGGQSTPMSDLHLVNPQQQMLYQKMLQGLMGGGGDFGYGSNIKQGTSQLQNMMAQRGVKVGTGGAYSGAYGNMVGNALGQDANARRTYAMQLLQSPLQIASATGHNYIPGSPSSTRPGSTRFGMSGFTHPNSALASKIPGLNDELVAKYNQRNGSGY